ncbi:MAG: hypothetical protein GY820_04260, partial [Gammaproteobacteria bacterium]|nr:hypothetical protein [Gammaproteobacteria bacterium]
MSNELSRDDFEDCKRRITFLENVFESVIGGSIKNMEAKNVAVSIRNSIGRSQQTIWFSDRCRLQGFFFVPLWSPLILTFKPEGTSTPLWPKKKTLQPTPFAEPNRLLASSDGIPYGYGNIFCFH